ncbi:hypothetical protein DVQ78_21805 [Yersinia enterocolitica]|nr:hypothetical protein [Yersinia enterocolitica]
MKIETIDSSCFRKDGRFRLYPQEGAPITLQPFGSDYGDIDDFNTKSCIDDAKYITWKITATPIHPEINHLKTFTANLEFLHKKSGGKWRTVLAATNLPGDLGDKFFSKVECMSKNGYPSDCLTHDPSSSDGGWFDIEHVTIDLFDIQDDIMCSN